MNRHLDLTAVAHLVGDPSRLEMLAALLAEGELSAGDLAAVAGVSKQTASAHLKRLQWGGLTMRADGAHGARHRVFRLADNGVAAAVAALVALATAKPQVGMTGGHDATTCYGHLGGALGKKLLGALLDQELLEPAVLSFGSVSHYRVSERGATLLGDFGIDTAGLQKQRRNFAKRCLNTHEASAHLSGSLADALLKGLLERGWVVQDETEGRVLEVTEAGRDGLANRFGVHLYTTRP